MEKKRVIQLGQRSEHLISEEYRRITESNRMKATIQPSQLHNYMNNEMNQMKDQQQNIWRSRLFSSGARNQRWFDKLQDYRNEV